MIALRHASLMAAVFVLAFGVIRDPASAETCGDVDANDQLTVTDGVNVLRAAAGLSGGCPLWACDVDGSGTITVTDGVNVLRAAAGLSASLSCVVDPFLASVQGENGVVGIFMAAPGGLTPPAGAPQTVTNVVFGDAFVSGRVNTVTVEYDVGAAPAVSPSLLVASARDAREANPGFFELPLDSAKGTISIALDLKPEVTTQQFTLKIANGASGNIVGQVFPVTIVVRRESAPRCGNRVLDPGETCDPPGFGCPAASGGGFCNAVCACEAPPRFTDNGDGTVTDHQQGLQWEKKTGTVAFSRNCTVTACPDPHDANNIYQWCLDTNNDGCDTAGNQPDGNAFTGFLAALNTPPCFAGHCDWRLPTVNRSGDEAELETILDPSVDGCGDEIACIDPIFGPTIIFGGYWTTTEPSISQDSLWVLTFNGEWGSLGLFHKANLFSVRAVRTIP